jgi:two-component system, cell cycle sensor histidine kinase and response regulator CckA
MSRSSSPSSDPLADRPGASGTALDSLPAESLDRFARLAARLLGVRGAMVTTVRGAEEIRRNLVGADGTALAVARVVPAEHSFCKHVLASAQPLIVADVRMHPATQAAAPALENEGIRACLGVPIALDGSPAGVLCAVHDHARSWTAEETAAVLDLAAFAEIEIALRHGRAGDDGATHSEQLASAELRHRDLLDDLPLVVYNVTPFPPYEPLYLSRGIEAFGWTAEEWAADEDLWVKQLHPEDRDRVLAEAEEARRSGESVSHEYRMFDRSGAVRWIHDRGLFLRDANAKPSSWRGIMMDVTAQKQAEERARWREELFRRTLENLRAPALTLDPDGHVTFANRFLAELLGATPDALVGVDWFERFVPAGDAKSEFLNALRRGEVPAHFENEIFAVGGARRLVAWDNVMLRDLEGRLEGVASIGQDIEVQRRLQEELRQAQKMEAVGRLAGGIAHDFNNILTAISGAAEFLNDAIPEQHEARVDVDQIRDSAARAGALTRQLLAFSRKQILQPRVMDLNSTVIGLEGLLSRLIGEDVHVVTHLDPALGAVLADPGQIEQVLINLAVNARDAMPRGGLLTIETANIRLDAHGMDSHEHPHDLPLGDYIRLTVRDTGSGMTPEVLARAFEPFFTTKPLGKGTGLGLATVFGIVKQSGGTVTVESSPGEGASFAIWLPRADQSRDGQPRDGLGAARGTETILLVEDESAVRTLARRVLEREGYTVLEARHGRDAIRIVDEREAPIHLVVSDAVMPEMDGPALIRALTARGLAVPVLLMSGYTDDEVVRRGASEPELSFLQKPFTARELAAAVRRVLDDAASQ